VIWVLILFCLIELLCAMRLWSESVHCREVRAEMERERQARMEATKIPQGLMNRRWTELVLKDNGKTIRVIKRHRCE
jgi:hypothetical protein